MSKIPTAIEILRDDLHHDLSNSLEILGNLHYLLRYSQGKPPKFLLYMGMADTQLLRLGRTSVKLRLAV